MVAALKMMRKTAAFPAQLCPFATDDAGNFLVADAQARIFDETRP